MSSPADYRYAAWLVLTNFNPQKHDTSQLIEKYASKIENRSGTVDIVLGVIRNWLFIDSLIIKISIQRKESIPEKTFNCLRIAVYEIIFSEQPVYAIVNEAVNLAKKTGSKKSAGFVNAILRKICGSIKGKRADLKNAEPRKTLPLTPQNGCEFNIDILPDPAGQYAQYLSSAFSLPLWLVKSWLSQFDNKKTLDICFASNRRPAIYARANKLKTTPEKLFETFKSQNIDCDFVEKYKCVRLNRPGNISKMQSFNDGLFMIQDITSSSVVPLLNPQSGWKIFDLCAAPGTKTTQIAELIDDEGLIIATDKDNARLSKVNENIKRLGIKSINTMNYDTFTNNSSYKSFADAVLLDVPCSNSGVLARRPEVRFRINLKKISELLEIQKELLDFAAGLIKPGGKICYSTCSILNQENNELITNFIKQHSEFTLEKENLVLPCACDCDFDGGYAVILVKEQN